jgi:hypothetical protein
MAIRNYKKGHAFLMPKNYSKQELENEKKAILMTLRNGPKQSFGSTLLANAALQSLKRAGKIQHRRKNQGGQGWELVAGAARNYL